MAQPETIPIQSRRHYGTLAELVADYLARTRDRQALRTFVERQRLLADFTAAVGHIPLADLIPDDLEKWVEGHTAWKSDWTLLRAAASVKAVFNWGRKKGLILANPFDGVSYRPGQRGNPITPEDFAKLLRDADPPFRRVLLWMSWTGSRPYEVANLEWSFLDAESGAATLHKHKTARTRKDRAPRVIYAPAVALRLLEWIGRGQHEGQPFVFLNSEGNRWTPNALSLRVWRARKRLGIPMSAKLYGVRHAWATELAVNGTELATLSQLLGHTSTRMSEHYIHLAGKHQHLRDALEKGLG